jgi:alkyl hydroperoxide reductase subunit F
VDKTYYDLLIIGAGPAGMTAAVYTARKGLRTLVVSKDIGGQVNWTTLVENYMGFEKIEGPELMRRFKEQMQSDHLFFIEDEVIGLRRDGENFILTGKTTREYWGKTVIVATGKRPRMLEIPGEEEFRGKGVSYCSTCDAPLFRDASVVVVGGGNSGVQAVLNLLAINAREVYLITDFQLTADQVLIDRIKDEDKVKLYPDHLVTEILGETMVTGVKIKSRETGEEQKISVEGIFIQIGLEPNSEFINELKKNERGEIVIDCHCRTNVPGVFAAGDVTHIPEKQIIVASGEGAKAALKAWEYLVNSRLASDEQKK